MKLITGKEPNSQTIHNEYLWFPGQKKSTSHDFTLISL